MTSIFGGLTIVGVSIATVCVILKRKKKLKKAKEYVLMRRNYILFKIENGFDKL